VFSSRLQSNLAVNRLAAAVARARDGGRRLVDLTESNPTRAGIAYPPDLLAPLGDRRGLCYEPEPLGLPDARRAVAGDYARRGIDVDPDRIVLTASTSEAYSLLFKVLCDPGDEVLVPRPSYPLFEHLAGLDGVVARPYDLEYHGRWSIDQGSIGRALTPRTRALLVVSPNNPTGSFVRADEMVELARACGAGDAVLVADEVFADYAWLPGGGGSVLSAAPARDALVVSLGGLSKTVGLPQVKLGWMALGGPDAMVHQLRARLELACDTYLSVSTPVQLAAGALLERGAAVRAEIRARVAANRRELLAQAARTPSTDVLEAAAGWYSVIQVPTFVPEEDLAVALVEEDDVLAHPGYFFDFRSESFLIVSLLPPEDRFRDGVSRILRRFA
jgi:aspartate/methionine/tyrosine aminotransferase